MNANCTKCGSKLRTYFLKDGVCNGCRNPHLIVTAQLSRNDARLFDFLCNSLEHCESEEDAADEIRNITGWDEERSQKLAAKAFSSMPEIFELSVSGDDGTLLRTWVSGAIK